MDNTYIQNKLDEFKKKYPDMKSENDEYTAIQTVDFIEEYLTDYHNHIVDKKHFEDNMLDGDLVEDCGSAMLSAKSVWEYLQSLQDTNPKE